MHCHSPIQSQCTRESKNGLGVRVQSISGDKSKERVKADRGQMGLPPQHMCCATAYICVPICQMRQYLMTGDAREMRF